jgi:hypothetical protein
VRNRAEQFPDYLGDQGRLETTSQEMIAQTSRGAVSLNTAERRKAAACRLARPLELGVRISAGEGGTHQRHGYTPRSQFSRETGWSVAARRPRLDPLASESSVVQITARGKVGHHLRGNFRWRAAAAEPRRELAARPRAPRKQISRGEPSSPGVELLTIYDGG